MIMAGGLSQPVKKKGGFGQSMVHLNEFWSGQKNFVSKFSSKYS